MLGKVSLLLMASGALLMAVSGLGTTCFNGRWYGNHWVEEFTWSYGTANKKAGDCAVTSTVFGTICAAASIAGFVLLHLGLGRLFRMIAFAVAAGCGLLTVIPMGVIVAQCNVFEELMTIYHEDQAYWVSYNKRTWVNESTDFHDWYFGFWDKQMQYSGGLGMSVIDSALQTLSGKGGFVHPVSMYWNSDKKRFDSVHAWTSEYGYTLHSYDCVVDFSQSTYDFRSFPTRDVCDTMKMKVVQCFSAWNEERLNAFLKESCAEYFDIYEGGQESHNGPESFTAYYHKLKAKLSLDMIEEGLATLWLSNAAFLSFMVVGLVCVIAGVALSFVTGDSGVNDTALLPE